MPLLRRLSALAVGSGLLTYAKCHDDGYKDRLKMTPVTSPGPRVAIIGAGVGGASCAYYLRERFRDNVTIDVYEKDKIGGRAAIVRVAGDDYESGASIIHGKNQYLVEFTKKFGLEKKPSSHGIFGLSDGKQIYFTGSKDQLTMALKMLWRYGLDFPKSLYFVGMMMEKFSHIYDLQNRGLAFSNVQDLLHACSVDFVRLSHNSLRGSLNECGFGERFINEIAMAAAHNNYGQSVNEIHGFAGVVALAGIASGLWSVKGGNYLIPENLMKESKANLIKAEVTEVKLLESGQYEVNYDKLKPRYDIVVLASPQDDRNQLKLTNFGRKIDLKSPYQRIVAHLVHGIVNEAYFEKSGGAEFPSELTITNPRNYFNTLNVNTSVQGSKAEVDIKELNVWKMFAKRPITDAEMGQIFTKINSRTAVDWLAYPHFSVRERLPSFIVHRHFYYVNAIERAASAMEMAAIAGRNVALLVYNDWKGQVEKIDNEAAILKGNNGSMISQPKF